ncbi:hypothetical protein EKO04_011610 [Ascochyta lentis]|uniref:Uncharacterized protein n=1 Tax=Ascochyta lentis TaxID=205686 RepID=A0A8H7IT96_9PLEO|nr:hypothetical protein EKO04_011610 [Ascochyta lentis]
MQPRSVLQQFLRPVSRAYPLPQQSGHHTDNPLHYIPYYINEAQRLLIARDTAIRELQHALAQKEKQHNTKKSDLQSQLWSMKMHYEAARQPTIVMEQARMKQEHHSSKLDSSLTPACAAVSAAVSAEEKRLRAECVRRADEMCQAQYQEAQRQEGRVVRRRIPARGMRAAPTAHWLKAGIS